MLREEVLDSVIESFRVHICCSTVPHRCSAVPVATPRDNENCQAPTLFIELNLVEAPVSLQHCFLEVRGNVGDHVEGRRRVVCFPAIPRVQLLKVDSPAWVA